MNLTSPAAEVPSCSPCLQNCYKSPAAVVPEMESQTPRQPRDLRPRKGQLSVYKTPQTPLATKNTRGRYKTKSPMPQTLPFTPEAPVSQSPSAHEQVVPQLPLKHCVEEEPDLKKRKKRLAAPVGSENNNKRPAAPNTVKDLLEIINSGCEGSS